MTLSARLQQIKPLLDEKVAEFNSPDFIQDDPISIPHQFSAKQDREIMGLIAAVMAWGQRKTIINNCNKLIDLMDDAPYDFVRNHEEKDLKRFLDFKHRTFNATDLLYFIEFFKAYYQQHDSLEQAFSRHLSVGDTDTTEALAGFYNDFFALEDAPQRTRKHIANPLKGSTCKRINMFLRWMVRDDDTGVDFGIWKEIEPSQLLCPLDLHVDRVARKLGLISIKQTNWKAVLELTENLRRMDKNDPVKYDFALFGLGVLEKF